MPRPTDDDLFAEEQSMPSMSFGEHIEELRHHLILALLGLLVGVLLTFIPPLSLGARVMRKLQDPAQEALNKFYTEQAAKRAQEARAQRLWTPPSEFRIDKADFAAALKAVGVPPAPGLLPEAQLRGGTVTVRMSQERAAQILDIAGGVEKPNALVSLAPMETFSIFFMVCIVTGLVVSSPWVFWELWLFVAAGLYRHERQYVRKFLPFALGLFLGGVFLCFFVVLPVTLQFLLEFNVWLGIEPTLRISNWIGFATILPLIFGVCFQTPLVMLILERVGIVSAETMRSQWKMVVIIMLIAAAIITPTQDPFSLALLAVPMILLYGLGLFLIGRRRRADVPAPVAG